MDQQTERRVLETIFFDYDPSLVDRAMQSEAWKSSRIQHGDNLRESLFDMYDWWQQQDVTEKPLTTQCLLSERNLRADSKMKTKSLSFRMSTQRSSPQRNEHGNTEEMISHGSRHAIACPTCTIRPSPS